MSRRRRAERRPVTADARYSSVELARFINKIMMKGKKTVAQRIVYSALDIVEEEAKRPPLEVFDQALKNATPFWKCVQEEWEGQHTKSPLSCEPPAARRWPSAG